MNNGMKIVAGHEAYARWEAQSKERLEAAFARMKFSDARARDEVRCDIQQDQAQKGRIGYLLVETRYGWGVRYDSGLQNFSIVASARTLGGSYEAAVEFAKELCAQNPSAYAWVR